MTYINFRFAVGKIIPMAVVVLIVSLMNVPSFAEGGYEYQIKWGSFGSIAGQFNSPYGIAVDTNGYVYIADFMNHRIQKFNQNGVFITTWGSYGSASGQCSGPINVATDISGNVFVADLYNYRIQKFTSDGSFLTKWGSYGFGDAQFIYTSGIAVDSSGYAYVVDGVSIYKIKKYDSSANFVSKWGMAGAGDGQFNSPIGIAIDKSGKIYVTDSLNHRIQKFNTEGTFLGKWGSFGAADGECSKPMGIATDAGGNIYVTEVGNYRVQKFSSDGVFITKWGSYGVGNGQFVNPLGIAVDTAGNVYVTDYTTHKVQKFIPLLYKLGGYIKTSGDIAIPGAVVKLSGSDSLVCTTGDTGYYEFSVPVGIYVLTASHFRYSFSPDTRGYVPLNTDTANQNFTGTQVLFSISGIIYDADNKPLIGAKVSITGDSILDYVTGDSGYYEFLLPNGNYTIMVAKESYYFTPFQRQYNSLDSDKPDQDFSVATPGERLGDKYRIEGYVREENGLPVKDVDVFLTGGVNSKSVTDNAGNYSFINNPAGDSYRIRPAKFGYNFEPKERNIDSLKENVLQGFTAKPVTEEKKTQVRKNLINPQKGEKTTISCNIAQESKLNIKIYNIAGTLVRQLVAENKSAGIHKYEWDGRDDDGNVVSSGVYRVLINIGDSKEEQKIVVLK